MKCAGAQHVMNSPMTRATIFVTLILCFLWISSVVAFPEFDTDSGRYEAFNSKSSVIRPPFFSADPAIISISTFSFSLASLDDLLEDLCSRDGLNTRQNFFLRSFLGDETSRLFQSVIKMFP